MTINKFGSRNKGYSSLKTHVDVLRKQIGSIKQMTGNLEVLDVGERRITNVSEPIDSKDATTKRYVDSTCLHIGSIQRYDASNRIITNVKDPFTDQDVVTLGYLKKYIKTKGKP